VAAMPEGGSAVEQQFQLIARCDPVGNPSGESTAASLESGCTVFFRGVQSSRLVEVSGENVLAEAGTPLGTRQRIVLEKTPPSSAVPSACAVRELIVEDQVWLFRRGVELSFVEKRVFAEYISGSKGQAPALLKAFSELWESEWQATAFQKLLGDDSTATDNSRSGQRKSKNWLRNIVNREATEPQDRKNGDVFMSALRSFFADSLRVSQLEANNVMRIVEAFAAALSADATFIQVFSPSMLPEKERKVYRTHEEVLFGLTYTTMMLNTDAHNKQVGTKMFDKKKFVEKAGKDCGVRPGVMSRIYKRVLEEEL